MNSINIARDLFWDDLWHKIKPVKFNSTFITAEKEIRSDLASQTYSELAFNVRMQLEKLKLPATLELHVVG